MEKHKKSARLKKKNIRACLSNTPLTKKHMLEICLKRTFSKHHLKTIKLVLSLVNFYLAKHDLKPKGLGPA
jgi:hypothetical protein